METPPSSEGRPPPKGKPSPSEGRPPGHVTSDTCWAEAEPPPSIPPQVWTEWQIGVKNITFPASLRYAVGNKANNKLSFVGKNYTYF